jgi:Na+/proline symporter
MNSKVGIVDYLVMVGILLISILIGLYYGYKKDLVKIIQKRRLRSRQSEVEMVNVIENNAIGPTKNGKQKNTEVTEYLTADGSIGILPIAFSLVATMFSSNSILANPGIQLELFFFMISIRNFKI